MSDVNQLWDACAQSIRDQVSDGVWNSTFKEARISNEISHRKILIDYVNYMNSSNEINYPKKSL